MTTTKIVSWVTLRRRLAAERRKGHSIVFTNGCFDLMHVGHVKVFEFCKKMGDVLVVGLNSDRSVRKLKGPKRPLISQNERATLLASLCAVDYVTIFNEDTPARLIAQVRPDVLAKGGDWKINEIVGRGDAKKVVRIPLIRGRSTSQLIETIVARYGR